LRQVVEAIDYCHSMNIVKDYKILDEVHRDIKLENLLIDEKNNIKLIDFGFSIIASNEQKLSIFCGTPSYYDMMF
jgi:MAP/microtubule affinity-regulating kinase